jgi:hypothetical protein
MKKVKSYAKKLSRTCIASLGLNKKLSRPCIV